jgi:hypothetical protein
MKKLVLIIFLICTKLINAQCSLTITGKNAVCVGVADTLTASGAISYTWMPGSDTGASIVVTPSVTITYTVTGTTGTCTVTNTINVTVHQLPAVTFTTNFGFNTFNVYPTYSSNVTSASWAINVYSYSSLYPYPYNGFTSHFYGLYPTSTISITNPGTGSYVTNYTICVVVGDSSGCADTSSSWNFNLPNVYCDGEFPCTWCDTNNTAAIVYDVNISQNQTTGVPKVLGSGNQVSIYPNPSTGNFVIETNATTKQTMQLIDVTGRIVLTQAINGKTSIDASNLPNGIYNMSLTSSEGVVNKRLVIAK